MKALVQEENKLRQNKKVKVVYEQKRDYPVKTLLKISGIPRNTYYYKINTLLSTQIKIQSEKGSLVLFLRSIRADMVIVVSSFLL